MPNFLVQKCNCVKCWDLYNEDVFIQSKVGMYPMLCHIHCNGIVGHLGYFLLGKNPQKIGYHPICSTLSNLNWDIHGICRLLYKIIGCQVDRVVSPHSEGPWFDARAKLLFKSIGRNFSLQSRIHICMLISVGKKYDPSAKYDPNICKIKF